MVAAILSGLPLGFHVADGGQCFVPVADITAQCFQAPARIRETAAVREKVGDRAGLLPADSEFGHVAANAISQLRAALIDDLKQCDGDQGFGGAPEEVIGIRSRTRSDRLVEDQFAPPVDGNLDRRTDALVDLPLHLSPKGIEAIAHFHSWIRKEREHSRFAALGAALSALTVHRGARTRDAESEMPMRLRA